MADTIDLRRKPLSDRVSVRDVGALGNGVAANSFFTAAIARLPLGGELYVPRGQYILTDWALSQSDITIIGEGDSTRFTVGAANSRPFNVTGARCKIIGAKLEGDGTTSNSTNGVGIYLDNAESFVGEDLSFDGFGRGACSATAGSTAKRGPIFIRPRTRNTQALGVEFYIGGLWRNIELVSPDCYSPLADSALVVFDSATNGWRGVTVRGGRAWGYRKQGMGVTDESNAGTAAAPDIWMTLIDGVDFKDCNWSGFKAKAVGNVTVVNCSFDGCAQQVESGTSLLGSLLLNANGKVLAHSNKIRNSGDAGIVVEKTFDYPVTSSIGPTRSQYIVSENMIDGVGLVTPSLGYAIQAQAEVSDVSILNNKARGVLGGRCIYVLGSAIRRVHSADIRGNTIAESPAAARGIVATYVRHLTIDTNDVSGSGTVALVEAATGIGTVIIGSADKAHDPGAVATYGYNIVADNIVFHGKAYNTLYPAWAATTAYARTDRVYNGNDIYQCEIAGTSAGATGPVGTSLGGAEVDGTVTWVNVGYKDGLQNGLRISGANTTGFVDGAYFDRLTVKAVVDAFPSTVVFGSNGGLPRQETIATDAAFTLTTITNAPNVRHTGTLTANRAVTLSTTNAFRGAKFRITRTGGGAFTLDVGTGPLKSLATNTWAEIEYDGTAWYLAAYGAL